MQTVEMTQLLVVQTKRWLTVCQKEAVIIQIWADTPTILSDHCSLDFLLCKNVNTNTTCTNCGVRELLEHLDTKIYVR